MKAVDLHLSATVSDDKHNVLIHQLPLKPVRYVRIGIRDPSIGTSCQDVGSGCFGSREMGQESGVHNIITDFISDVKVNVSKLTRDHTLSPRIASSIALGWPDLSPQWASQ